MLRSSQVKVDSVRYQRNGSSGDGFYAIAFRFREGRSWTPMVATLEAPADGEALNRAKLFVICPSRPRDCWDGYAFTAVVFEAIKRADQTGEMYRQ